MDVIKVDGSRQPKDESKILKKLTLACEGVSNVNIMDIYHKANIQFYDGMKSSEIQEILIEAARNLISLDTPNYDIVAGRLMLFDVRKKAYGCYEPPKFLHHVKAMVKAGRYDKEILEHYSDSEINKLGEAIDHDRDLNYRLAAMFQWTKKYLVQDRAKGKLFESPQMANMLISMIKMQGETDKVAKAIKFYDALSLSKISLPTPIMGGVRTPTRQFSSCTLIEAGDSLDSINGVGNAIVKYASMRAGIGLNFGRVRALGSPIRNGEAKHTGLTPFIKKFTSDLKSCSQGALRGASGTGYYPFWHLEFPELVVLKNNKGVDENRERRLDYGVQFNDFFFERYMKDEVVTLFCPNDVEGLYEAFFDNPAKFKKLYLKAEKDPNIRKKRIKASDLLHTYMMEYAQTGRVYPMFVDNVNQYSPWDLTQVCVKQSNLCLEIALPTEPLDANDPDKGEIALCTLGAFNLGAIEDLSELEELADLLVRGLDFLLDYQSYPVKAAEKAKNKRSLGVGVTNYAYYLAKHGARYSDSEGDQLTHELFEAIQYYLIKASCNLAKEKGKCKDFGVTRYAQGQLPIDWYKKTVDEIAKPDYKLDWESLRKDVAKYGMRNTTLTALMPSETSSQIGNATNGIEPPRDYITVKGNKDGKFSQVIPDIENLLGFYETAWQMPDNNGYLNKVAIMQKFIDQTISANTYHVPSRYKNGKIPMTVLVEIFLKCQYLGIKTLYYLNTEDGSGADVDCDSCKI